MKMLYFSWFSLSLLGIVTALLAYICSKWYRERVEYFSLFERMGVPGPKPNLIFGNFYDMKGKGKVSIYTMDEWEKKYGEIYGFFEGYSARLAVSDLELAKQILIKESNNFINRESTFIDKPPFTHTLVGMRNQRWKDTRSLLSPTFSAAKMKLMTPIMNNSVTDLMNVIDKKVKANEELNIQDLYQRQTMDVIGECALAMKIDSQLYDGEHPILRCARETFSITFSFSMLLIVSFPMLRKLVFWLLPDYFMFFGKPLREILRNVEKVVQYRRQNEAESKEKNIDVLQLMLDASEERDDESPDAKKGKKHKLTLTDEEVVGNAFTFLLAGYETTSSALSYTSYFLAKYPEIQEKLYLELKDNLTDLGDGSHHISYDRVQTLPFLEQVLYESLRLVPPIVTFIFREAAKDIVLEDSKGKKIHIPKGLPVIIPVWQIHHNPKLWPDPLEFKPERFSLESRKEHHSLAWMPFGAGPRNCIGMRFAILEAKATLARLLLKYRLLPCSKTSKDIINDFDVPGAIVAPKNGVYLKAELRR